MGHIPIKHLFLCDSNGRLISRRPDIWSARAPVCVDCGTTEKPHEAFGRCRLCYLKWKRKTDPEWAERTRLLHKLAGIRSGSSDRSEAKRVKDGPWKQRRKVVCHRYYQKVAKWPIGCAVDYDLVPGFPPILGTVIETNNGSALVEFATFTERIPFRRLRRHVWSHQEKAA
jgi:hypothetical protein